VVVSIALRIFLLTITTFCWCLSLGSLFLNIHKILYFLLAHHIAYTLTGIGFARLFFFPPLLDDAPSSSFLDRNSLIKSFGSAKLASGSHESSSDPYPFQWTLG
jgi:hypothetical protein